MVSTTRNERSKPTTNWSERVKPDTNWSGRIQPSTDWSDRIKPITDWAGRIRPINFFQPLRDAENIVCNENGEIIYIFANEGEPISMTIWTERA